MSIANIIALALVIAILLGVVPALLPGASYEAELDRELRSHAQRNWQITLDDGCRVDMPHGRKHCAHVTETTTIYMDGY